MAENQRYTILSARSEAEIEAARSLFRAYADSLGFDLAYQDFEAELTGLPGKYAPPKGEILLALDGDGRYIGCVALRPLTEGVCEMKRLFVSPEGRGLGLGKALTRGIIAEAEKGGYREMRLDTFPSMAAAVGIYEAEGFVAIAPYYDTPMKGTVFMSKRLA